MPIRRHSILFLLLSLSLPSSAPAAPGRTASTPPWSVKPLSQFTHRSWSRDQGLPQNSVNAILRARNGYLWIGTQEGAARFDGTRFTVFNRRTTPAFRSHYIWSLFEDRSGAIWAGTNGGGVTVLNTNEPVTYGLAQGLPGTTVWSFCEDRGGTLWLGTNNGLAYLPSKARGISNPVFRTASQLKGVDIRCIVQDSSGTIWLGTNRGLFAMHDTSVRNVPLPGKPTVHAVDILNDHGRRSVFVGAGNALYRIDSDVPRLVARLPVASPTLLFSLGMDTSGAVWVATAGAGVWRLANGEWSSFTSVDGLPDDQVRALLIDDEGTVWIGTYGGGLNALHDATFSAFTRHSGLANEFILSLSEGRDGSLWVGTYGGGVSRLNGSDITNYPPGRNGIPSNVTSLFASRQGPVFVSSPDLSLLALDPTSGVAHPVRPPVPSGVNCLFEDHDGLLWAGSSSGVTRVDGSRTHTFSASDSPITVPVISIAEGSDSSMWFGTLGGGLIRLRNGTFVRYASAEGLASDVITAILPAPDGTLWIGTDGGGLIYFNGERFSSITTSRGLYDDVVFTILEDGEGYLWMSSNNGIFRANTEDLIRVTNGRLPAVLCESFGTADGMRSSECNGRRQPSAWKDHLGRLWFATLKGLVMVDPADLHTPPIPPRVVIEQISADERPLEVSDGIEIAPGMQRLVIEYAALSFVSPERTLFRFQLEGYDADWVDAGSRRTAYYTSLSPGEYRFRVSARNNRGTWNDQGATFRFRLRPFFYQTPIFLAGTLFTLILAAYALGRLRVWRLQRREIELVDLVAERTESLIGETRRVEEAYRDAEEARKESERQREIAEEANKLKSRLLHLAAHDMKSPLISIKGFTQIMREEVDRNSPVGEMVGMIHSLTLNLLALINQLLNSEAIESGQMAFVPLRLDASQLARDVIAANTMFASKKRQSIEFDGASWGECLVEADEARLRDAYDNLLTNAIKYSREGTTVRVRVARIDALVRFSVQDEGPGLTADDRRRVFGKFQRLSAQPTAGESSTGLGLSITKEIVEMHQGTIFVESEEGHGSTFFIDLPAAR